MRIVLILHDGTIVLKPNAGTDPSARTTASAHAPLNNIILKIVKTLKLFFTSIKFQTNHTKKSPHTKPLKVTKDTLPFLNSYIRLTTKMTYYQMRASRMLLIIMAKKREMVKKLAIAKLAVDETILKHDGKKCHFFALWTLGRLRSSTSRFTLRGML